MFEQEPYSRERSVSHYWVGWSFLDIVILEDIFLLNENSIVLTTVARHHSWHVLVFQMSVASMTGKEKEEGLRLELKNVLERAEAAEGALARKEVSVASTVTTWSKLQVRSHGPR